MEPDLVTEPVISQKFAAAEPPCNFQEHCANQWHPPIDRCAAKLVPSPQGQGYVFNNLCKKYSYLRLIFFTFYVVLSLSKKSVINECTCQKFEVVKVVQGVQVIVELA